jgi:hypothetical protein
MNGLESLLIAIDPFLIAPYRFFSQSVLAWWFGTFVLAVWCLLLGEITLSLARRLNREPIMRHSTEAKRCQASSLNALRAGDKEAYKAINRLANESFGRSFFLSAAMGMGALWPLFFAAGWLDLRYKGVKVSLLGLPFSVNWVVGFLCCYIGARVLYRRCVLPWVKSLLSRRN